MPHYSGGCLCGSVRLDIDSAPNRVGICHCLDCRKRQGAIFHTFAVFPRNAVTVTGEPLPEMPQVTGSSPFTTADDDPAIGKPAPKLQGESFDGSNITIDPGDGTPRVIVFVAHWCPHCQKEVPLIQEWIDDGNLPEGVEIVFVSTAVNEPRGNYPPSAWIVEEGVTPRVLLDDDQSAAAADYGLTSFPYFVMTNGEGEVVARGSGEIPMDQFGAAVDALAKGQDPAAAG